MNTDEARYLFEEADRLYRAGHCLEALQHLSELNRDHPGMFNILFPILLCFEKLGRTEEAYDLCVEMLEQFPAEKHQLRLRAVFGQICRARAHAAANGNARKQAPGHEFIEDQPHHTPMDKPGVLAVGGYEIPWGSILTYGLFVAAILLLAGSLPVIIGKWEAEQNEGVKTLSIFLLLLSQFTLTCLIGYTVLWTMNKLIHEDMVRDIIDVCIAMGIFMAINLIVPLIGWFVGIYMLARHYDMGLGEAILFVCLQTAFNLVFMYLMVPLVFGTNAAGVMQYLG